MPSFVSHAQNFEDLMLWRALKHVNAGFYIDVGAYSPVEESVTLAFYERGWRGINIEPLPTLYPEFVKARSRDINLQLAVGQHSGTAELQVIDSGNGLSTLDQDIAAMHEMAGYDRSTHQTTVCPLADICQRHVPEGQQIHFLKIDVEGFEYQVIAGNDWSRFRPWILVVEATIPNSQIPNHERWDPLLRDAAYRHVYSDGLNRFYIAEEHMSLADAFLYPPNVFDDFTIARQPAPEDVSARSQELVMARMRAEKAEHEAHEAQQRARAAEERSTQAAQRAEEAVAALQRMQNRLAWRITAPLRYADRQANALRSTVIAGYRNAAAVVLRVAVRMWRRYPALQPLAHSVLRRLPVLHARLDRFGRGRGIIGSAAPGHSAATTGATPEAEGSCETLSPRARSMLSAIEAAIARRSQDE